MRYLIALIFFIFPMLSFAQDWEDRRVFNSTENGEILRVLSSTDTALFAAFIEEFVADNPSISIEYLVTGTADLDRRFRAAPEKFDLVISSAMDLQFKLANDGLAARIDNLNQPDWAQWRQSLFAFTSESAAIVVNRSAFQGHPLPKTRQELIQALRARPETFRGRVGTYDIRQSGLGYLFATQDARASETYWRLMEVMGGLNLQLYCCSGDMIDDISDGTLLVAYNVLGSYASARTDDQNVLDIILPSEFPTTMMRTVLVSSKTTQPENAARFLRKLVTQKNASLLLPTFETKPSSSERSTISLQPALMTFLDTLKRRKFIAEWEAAVIQ
jgi:iron(III) transport system substrate-binding protein